MYLIYISIYVIKKRFYFSGESSHYNSYYNLIYDIINYINKLFLLLLTTVCILLMLLLSGNTRILMVFVCCYLSLLPAVGYYKITTVTKCQQGNLPRLKIYIYYLI